MEIIIVCTLMCFDKQSMVGEQSFDPFLYFSGILKSIHRFQLLRFFVLHISLHKRYHIPFHLLLSLDLYFGFVERHFFAFDVL